MATNRNKRGNAPEKLVAMRISLPASIHRRLRVATAMAGNRSMEQTLVQVLDQHLPKVPNKT